MFDKLVESDTAGAEFKNRSRYFLVSSVVVGILFLTAVVYSLYAAEIGIGSGNLEIAELISPLDTAEPVAETLAKPPINKSETDDQITRRVLMPDTENSTLVPNVVSVSKNPYRTRSADRFKDVKIGSFDSVGVPSGRNRTDGGTSSNDWSGDNNDEVDTAKSNPPPPVIKQTPKIVRTSKVLNGDAISLPKPSYPRTAAALNLEGTVRIQITIDEAGNVISAKAADGHPFFRPVAEQAARNAKFRPTLLNDVPVKVTGVIVYNFRKTN